MSISVRSDVLLWAQRILAWKGAPPHQLLELPQDAGVAAAQAAFHKIARIAHPDLHRNSLTEEELELVTTAYARVAAAYQDLRSQSLQTGRTPPLSADPPPPLSTTRQPTPPRQRPVTGRSPPEAADAGAPADASRSGGHAVMAPKALRYYRKAELCLRRGDLKDAVLQLKMAIACDPQSSFLRTALAEVEAEVGKK